ncbi:hypothetical protein COY95_03270, partial [Candidatus Woesearchaeota archaeon CG_4_10_14_0_8_um_filter_47_5]
QITLNTHMKENPSVTYFFEITPQQFTDIIYDVRDINLSIEVIDESPQEREADIVINGHLTHLYTRDRIFKRNIEPFVEEGNNGIRIFPRSKLEIVKVIVALE